MVELRLSRESTQESRASMKMGLIVSDEPRPSQVEQRLILQLFVDSTSERRSAGLQSRVFRSRQIQVRSTNIHRMGRPCWSLLGPQYLTTHTPIGKKRMVEPSNGSSSMLVNDWLREPELTSQKDNESEQYQVESQKRSSRLMLEQIR
jgi:hypothetical protein